mgnify:CR=1 FL=1
MQNWQDRWSKLKSFVKQRQSVAGLAKRSARSELSNEGKEDIFRAILALYAGEDLVFHQLRSLAERFPAQVEFYVPQLCTYLFHFDDEVLLTEG